VRWKGCESGRALSLVFFTSGETVSCREEDDLRGEG